MSLEFIWKGSMKAKVSGIFGDKKKRPHRRNPSPWVQSGKTPQDGKAETHSEECTAKEHSAFLNLPPLKLKPNNPQ